MENKSTLVWLPSTLTDTPLGVLAGGVADVFTAMKGALGLVGHTEAPVPDGPSMEPCH